MKRIILGVAIAASVAAAGTAYADPPPNNGPTTVVGTRGDDKLGGNRGPDILIGKGGDDRLWGGRGPDIFRCGPGWDVAHNVYDTGNDTFYACEVVKS